MSTIDEAKKIKKLIQQIVNKAVANHPDVKSAIKSKKAIVVSAPNTSAHTVSVSYIEDVVANGTDNAKRITLPYNPNIPTSSLSVGDVVSVWYAHDISNAIVMQNATWSV